VDLDRQFLVGDDVSGKVVGTYVIYVTSRVGGWHYYRFGLRF
jgi:hypothetical protein